MSIEDWHEVVQDREKWRDIVVTAKILREYKSQKKKINAEVINNRNTVPV